jgi:prevent-host-death family protein
MSHFLIEQLFRLHENAIMAKIALFGGRAWLMKSMSAQEAKDSFGRLIDTVCAAPVVIEKHGRPVVVVLSVEEYERLRAGDSKKARAWTR